MSASDAGRMLGVSGDTVNTWIGKGLPVAYKNARNLEKFVNIRDLEKFAIENPKFFGGLKYRNLILAFGCPDLAKEICTKYPYRYQRRKAVYCLTTRQKFNSAAEAAKAFHIVPSTLRRAIANRDGYCGGHRFRYIDE